MTIPDQYQLLEEPTTVEIIKENPQTAFRYVACNADRYLTKKFLVDIETLRMALIRKEKKGPLGRPSLQRVDTVAGKSRS